MKNHLFFSIIVALLIFMQSCLTIEKKEYSFKFISKDKGVLTIKFINIMSVVEDETDLKNDFEELIKEYVEGDLIENGYPFTKVISKRLFEEKGMLCGEVKLEFSGITAVRLFQYEEDGPLMFSLNKSMGLEEYKDSNGNFGGEIMPVVFWSEESMLLKLSTAITKPDKSCISLLARYNEWKKKSKISN
jgi:hypothetical protein